MRVCLLIHELGRSGGVSTILRYARALDGAEPGAGAELVVTDPRAGELPAEHGGVPVRRLADAAGERYDVAVATWWATVAALWRVDAARRLVFLQSVESRFYEERHFHERLAAEQVLALPVGYVTVARWIGDLLAALRPDAPCAVVRNGIDKDVFRPPAAAAGPPPGGPLRVLVEGQPSLWFKGVQDGVAAVRAMSEPVEATVVASDPAAAGALEGMRVVGGLDPAGMAALYSEHDVLLKLSRVEGLPLPPIEAFHVGVPAVLAPFGGHDEYLDHGRNGLVAGHDDLPGTARALDGLARDRGRLAELSAGALATAAGWPSADEAAAKFVSAVERLAAGPEPDPAAALAALQAAQTRRLELTREHVRQQEAVASGLRGAVRWHEDALAQARDHVEELNERLREADRLARDLHGQIEAIKATRAYRAATAARRLKPGGGG
ncbi:MAG TPA: glycosyltransferase family 4 protein [Thermoleophilaceae bacterium]